ncbi:uncharacterized protein EDB91DRAFT_435520 [Suillus paluster]|uniref:uncharacterized protein n=1 Tax=Suillus paluster TaxID=48578 RepID=UPI001B87D012|nr:uncharacterized protein EDB91DRAFT_435520 [Suillus paluster]KAG1754076.1 hypothetical protein EDB91DRAFT_435520 [Suillus paluster]
MSHFNGHPYHTMPTIHPSRNNHPLPLSPPETDQESFHAQLPPACFAAGAELEQLAHSTSGLPERPRIVSRRTSTLSYQNSGVRDGRERTLSRGSKSLIVVLPPPDFPLDHSQLGSVLSMGPRHRLSQGILMPLFPTMYGQLTAIAREFNFPSTVGLCLYHHITDNGITVTPRISDDAWQYLWGHLIESRSSSGGSQLPIGGRIEFDIDFNKARWFDAWLSGTLRDDTIVPAPQSHASIHHLRGDSKNTFAEEHIANEDRWDNQTTRSNSRPATIRHAPKKLSLVDRLDSTALQASYKASQATSPPANRVAHQLSPIPQSAAPPASKAELHRRVNSWRASAFLDPASMTESYQPVPDATLGAGAIEAMDEYPLEAEVEEPLNLADFAWSVTSAGPPSPPLDSPASHYRLPSVHLDRRMLESAPLTPSTATSWGPPDDDRLSDVSSIDRLPSPDIGRRMLESAPLTPATATSWGPADDWQSDVSSVDRLPSPDIAHRVVEDALVSHVSMPGESYSPWVGMSASSSSWFDVTKVATLPSTTSYNPWAGMPWVQVWPWSELDSTQSGDSYSSWAIVPAIRAWPWFDIRASEEKKDPELERSTSLNPWAGMPWFNVGPWHDVNGAQASNSVVISLSRSGGLKPAYPSLDIYPAAYPYFDIYPAFAEDVGQNSSAGGYPIFEIYPVVYPYFNLYPSIACSTISSPEKPAASQPPKTVIVELEPTYPLFNLYPPLYPYNLNSIYPAPTVKLSLSVLLPSTYPWLIIYSPVYPHVNPYSQASAEVTRTEEAKDEIAQPVQVKLQPQYPILDIYPAGYPWNLYKVYPPIKVEDTSEITVRLSSRYPWLDIYPSVYPFIEPYSMQSRICESPSSRSQTSFKSECVKVTLDRYYPSFDLYPMTYPHFDLYPASPNIKSGGSQQEQGIDSTKIITDSVSVDLAGTYPYVFPYPPAYPHFDLYPRVQIHASRDSEDMTDNKSFVSSSTYPFLVIYSPVYPHFDLYPAQAAEPASREEDTANGKFFISRSTYPFLAIYPLVYPHFNLYPTRAAELARREESLDMTDGKLSVSSSSYPFLTIYPPVYPHFDLYPTRAAEPVSLEESLENMTDGKLSVSAYPFLVIYPPVYPHFDLYPTRAAEPVTREESMIPNITASSYPYLVVYPPVYPYFDLYPGIPPTVDALAASSKLAVRIDHGYPVLNIYPAVYPHFDIYPAFSTIAQPLQKVFNMSVCPLSARGRRKTHAELHTEAAPLPMPPVTKRKPAKTHRQLHAEVFANGVTWTPSGYVQDLALPNKSHEERSRGPGRRMPSIHEVGPRLSRSRSGTLTGTLTNQQAPNSPSLRERQPPVLHNVPPIPPLRISSPGVPAAAEFPIPISPPVSPTSRLSQAVRSLGSSIMPGIQGRNLTSTSDDHNERAKSPTRSMFPSFDRRSSVIPSPPPHDPSDLIGRSRSPVHQAAQSLVLQRAKAYEQSTVSSKHHSHNMRGTQFSLPQLPSLLSVSDFHTVKEGSKTDS